MNLASDSTPTSSQNEKIKPGVKLDFDTKKGLTFDQTLDSDQLRLNWESQGGFIRSTEVAMNYIITKMEFSDSLSGDMKLDGFGFGYTFNKSFLKFSPPNYAENKYYSYAVKLGFSAGINVNMFESKYENVTVDTLAGIGIITNDVSINNDIRIGTMEFGLNLGVNVGLGRFLNPQKWGGVILGVAWRPTWQWTSTNTTITTDIWYEFESLSPYIPNDWNWTYYEDQTTDENTQFSWSAVEFSLDFGGIKAMTDKMAKRAHFRLNLMIIPPLGDYKMSMLYLGMGMVWYK